MPSPSSSRESSLPAIAAMSVDSPATAVRTRSRASGAMPRDSPQASRANRAARATATIAAVVRLTFIRSRVALARATRVRYVPGMRNVIAVALVLSACGGNPPDRVFVEDTGPTLEWWENGTMRLDGCTVHLEPWYDGSWNAVDVECERGVVFVASVVVRPRDASGAILYRDGSRVTFSGYLSGSEGRDP
jgi:hypothetical protein